MKILLFRIPEGDREISILRARILLACSPNRKLADMLEIEESARVTETDDGVTRIFVYSNSQD